MSNGVTSPLGTQARVRAGRGLRNAQLLAATLIHQKPLLSFPMPASVIADDTGNILEGEAALSALNDGLAQLHTIEVDFHFKIDPKKIRPEHNNRIQAVRDRLNAAQRTMEKMAAATGMVGGKTAPGGIRREDLPDTGILVELYEELDRAVDERLLACVMTTSGLTMWDYVDENGNHINLTSELLRNDLKLAENIHAAFQEWYSPTKASLEAVTLTKQENGTTEATQATPNPLPLNSASPSGAPVNSESTTATDSYPTGMNQ